MKKLLLLCIFMVSPALCMIPDELLKLIQDTLHQVEDNVPCIADPLIGNAVFPASCLVNQSDKINKN